jgi:hypothetical protein
VKVTVIVGANIMSGYAVIFHDKAIEKEETLFVETLELLCFLLIFIALLKLIAIEV